MFVPLSTSNARGDGIFYGTLLAVVFGTLYIILPVLLVTGVIH